MIDGQNRRVARKLNGVLTQRLLYQSRLEPLAEFDSSGSLVARYVYGMRRHVPDYVVKGPSTYRIISDHLGSVRLVVNTSSGSVAQRIDYDAYGMVTYDSSPGFQCFGYAGGLWDPATGLVRFGARDYDSATGRWTLRDPIGFSGSQSNLYLYADGDPLDFNDPFGLKLCRVSLPGVGTTYLDDSFVPRVEDFIRRNIASGVNVRVTSAFRTSEHQAALQTDPSAITPAQISLHEAGFAIDIGWPRLTPAQQSTVRRNARDAGLGWGGRFKSPDPVHFYREVPGGGAQREKFIEEAQRDYADEETVCDCPK
jgi:RHS repeat-associated protein